MDFGRACGIQLWIILVYQIAIFSTSSFYSLTQLILIFRYDWRSVPSNRYDALWLCLVLDSCVHLSHLWPHWKFQAIQNSADKKWTSENTRRDQSDFSVNGQSAGVCIWTDRYKLLFDLGNTSSSTDMWRYRNGAIVPRCLERFDCCTSIFRYNVFPAA